MITPADPADFPAIAALNHAAYREMAERVPAWREEAFFHSLVAARAQRATFFVLRRDDEIVASVAYAAPGQSADPIPAPWASVLLLAVHPAHRGCGYGRVLATACITLAVRDRAETIGLFTSELMGVARGLYEGLGFTVERELPPRLGLRYWLYRHDMPT